MLASPATKVRSKVVAPLVRFLATFVLVTILSANVAAQLPPRLQIAAGNLGEARVQWPVGDGLGSLEELLSFDGVARWQPAPQAPQLASPFLQLDLTLTNRTRFFRLAHIAEPAPGVVPSPDTLATPPPVNVQESFADSTSFLYTGTNSVQIGVGPGTITAQRAAVLRGRIKKRDGSALAGAHVSIRNYPEFGYTYTRADGMYDLAVNGGPLYTLDFQLRSYCPAQRQVQSPAQDFAHLDDIILVAADPIATAVAFSTNAPLQAAKSSVNTDKAGSRSATVLFPPGTCASLVLPDGSTRDCGALTIRATEFTVGPNGPQAMPAPLPPTSAYTYAVELSADEGSLPEQTPFNSANP